MAKLLDIDAIYPVGSVYITMDASFDPAAKWGGAWSKIESGRFIEATDSNPGELIEAGLPNITGTFSSLKSVFSAYSGAFSGPSYGQGLMDAGHSAGDFVVASFDASRCSKLYRDNFDKVQPKSITAIVWYRTA